MIQEFVVINGHVLAGALNDDGSVTRTGVADGIELFGDEPVPFEGCDFEVTLHAGPAGVGGFVYQDCVVPPPGDVETVFQGHILIH